jgi:hypothetical protein
MFGRPVAADGNPYFGLATMTTGAMYAILGAMAAFSRCSEILDDGTCP